MTFKSKFDSNCKDCGEMHAIGDLIAKNGNGNYCRNGLQCKAAPGQTPAQQSFSINPVLAPSNAQSGLQQRIDNAKQAATAFVKLMKELQAEAALANAASVFNTELMRK